jgi:hypothetical protein
VLKRRRDGCTERVGDRGVEFRIKTGIDNFYLLDDRSTMHLDHIDAGNDGPARKRLIDVGGEAELLRSGIYQLNAAAVDLVS